MTEEFGEAGMMSKKAAVAAGLAMLFIGCVIGSLVTAALVGACLLLFGGF